MLGVGTQARVIGEAMLKYGIMVADGTSGSNVQLAGIGDWRWSSDLLKRLDSIPVTALEVVQLQPSISVAGPSTLAVGQQGTWTFSFTNPGEPGPAIINIWNCTDPTAPKLQVNRFVILGSPNPGPVTQSYTFTAAGTYCFRPYQRLYTDWNNLGLIVTVQ